MGTKQVMLLVAWGLLVALLATLGGWLFWVGYVWWAAVPWLLGTPLLGFLLIVLYAISRPEKERMADVFDPGWRLRKKMEKRELAERKKADRKAERGRRKQAEQSERQRACAHKWVFVKSVDNWRYGHADGHPAGPDRWSVYRCSACGREESR